MIRGRDFYAVWVEERGLWSTNEQDLINLVDKEVDKFTDEYRKTYEGNIRVSYMWDSDSGRIDAWHKYCQRQMRDSFHMLDEELIFSNTETNKKNYASKRLPYPLEEGFPSAWDRLISTLYSPDERRKLEWAIGSIVAGDSKNIQKFLVLYGAAGTGKSTILNIIQMLFDGYYSVFDAKALGSASNSFALEAFKSNPLVAIQHDGDLSKIEDNTRLNSLVSHELMTVNEKFKSTYSNRFKCFLFMGTNKPVKITDAKSGLIRRLIDVTPSGNKLSRSEYQTLMDQIPFELGCIASHCRDVYLSDPGYYDSYVPLSMMGASNDFYNFVVDSFSVFFKEDGTTLKAAWEMYKTYCEDARVPYPMSKRNFKEELKNYFRDYAEKTVDEDGNMVSGYYSGFKDDIFDDVPVQISKSKDKLIKFESIESILDKECSDCPAQYANNNETPSKAWDSVSTKLSDLDTKRLHYLKVPENHIVIDFDIPDETGKKSFDKNIKAASKWPATYAELSKSGQGIHLHYIYNGDVNKLCRLYDDHIEIKVFTGKSSLRRKLTKCNNLPIATISSGLPTKGEDKLVDFEAIKSERALRSMITKNLNKEIHSATKPSVDFIFKILEDAYKSGLKYDVSDLKNPVYAFATHSTNNAPYCIKLVNKMKFKSEDNSESVNNDDEPLIFYDVEVFPNLFLINWKQEGEGKKVVRMINPSPSDVENLIRHRLVGFNCRKYDNHILYGRLIGYSNEQLYDLSQRIINGEKNTMFGEAYNMSYTDVYDFAAKKQSLKKWEIELGIHHKELGLPWDQPVPEDLWPTVAEYCDNDVLATEAVFNHLSGDFTARKILANLAGMSVNDTTNSLTTRIIFGREKKPKLVYTDLATGEQFPPSETKSSVINSFPGYKYVDGKNIYRNEDIGFGGYIRSWEGIYTNVALLDVASLHPNSIRAMNCFGDYTKNFTDILDARIAIKHKDFDAARNMLDGKLAPFLEDESKAKDLAQALKIAINSVYGLTAANFDNPFRDIRNKNNIVALRGALFMKTLQDEVESRGYRIVAIKTDSIKIANATKDIISFCMDFAKQYGYSFEHEATYDRMCQVNDADYIALYKDSDWCMKTYGYVPDDNAKHPNTWTVTGAKFAVPYVFKTLFSKEPITFEDMCETKAVKTAIYLDLNENLEDVSKLEKELYAIRKGDREHERQDELIDIIAKNHDYRFVGKVGLFCPIKPGCGGGELLREGKDKEGNVKYDSVTGAKGYRWLESEMVKNTGRECDIDKSYYMALVDDAVETISQYGDVEMFISVDDNHIQLDEVPWYTACGKETCNGCEHLIYENGSISCRCGYDNSDQISSDYENDMFKKR